MKRIPIKTNLLLLGLCLCISMIATAQTKKTSITGTVKDSTNSALMYATVSLFKANPSDTVPLKLTYTNDKGGFKINGVDTGSYRVVVSYTGYAEKQHDVTVKDGVDTDLGEISLQSASNLQGVVVTAKKPLVEQQDDKIIFNVENDPTTKTETAIDILRKTPFVTVDGDNNVLVNGQSNFKVLLNGRETAMFVQNVKEALRSFPGAMIVKIEVITSPGAKYDGEGVGGVINIITKKKVVGYNGSLSTYVSSTRWSNLNASFSAKFGKFGVTLNYGAGGTDGIEGKSQSETIPLQPSFYTRRYLDGTRKHSNFWNYGNLEVSFEMDSLNTISTYGNVSGGWNKNKLDQTITTEFPTDPTSITYYDLNGRNEYPTKTIGTDYIRKFNGNKEKEFSVRLNGEFGNANTFTQSVQDNPVNGGDRYIDNESVANNKQFTVQSDYIHPLKSSQKLESGVKGIFRRANSDFQSMIKYHEHEAWEVNEANTDYFDYRQDVYSAYSTFHFKVNKTNFRIGARVEHTIVDGNFQSSSTEVKQEYTTFLPNLQSTTKIGNAYTLVLTYGKRLQRPFIWNLNPFVNNNDSLNISYGNPDLEPQIIHSLSSQLRIVKGTTFAGVTLTATYSDDMIMQYATFDKTTGVTSTTSLNIGEEMQLSMNLNITAKPNPDWNIFLNGNIRYNKVRNKAIESQKNQGFGGNANINSNYNITKRFNVSGYAGFWRSPVTIQYTYPLNGWYGLGAGYKFFKEKLNVTLSATNFFLETRTWKMTINDPNFTTTRIDEFPYRGIAIGATWNFGKMTENVSKKKGVSNDDLIGGGSSNSN